MALDINKAKEELRTKSYHDIQESTAWSWASRAAAEYANVLTAPMQHKIGCWTYAEEYHHEAIEHAALVEGGNVALLSQVNAAVEPYKTRAAMHLARKFKQEDGLS